MDTGSHVLACPWDLNSDPCHPQAAELAFHGFWASHSGPSCLCGKHLPTNHFPSRSVLSINNYSYKYQDNMQKNKGTFSYNHLLAEKQAGM